MARPGGLELPTFWFVARRSIQLSYGRAVNKYYHSPALRIQPRPQRTNSNMASTRRDLAPGPHGTGPAQATFSPPAGSSLRTKLLLWASEPIKSNKASVNIVTTSKPAIAR